MNIKLFTLSFESKLMKQEMANQNVKYLIRQTELKK